MLQPINAGTGGVFHIKSPTFPEFRFEWHDKAGRVYAFRVGATPEIGEPIADRIDTQHGAYSVVAAFAFGWRAATAPKVNPPKLGEVVLM